MQLVLPDILDELRGFSPALGCLAFVLGLLLWLLGWRGHRFWIVLIATIVAGLVGLYSGPAHTTQPILAGLLLAVSAGVMALALVRLVAFAAGGAAAFLAVHALIPQWQQPLLSFLAGGLFGIVVFRLWTIALTSAAGTLVMTYSGLCLLNGFGKVEVVKLAERQVTAINCVCGGVALLGIIGQLVLDRRARPRAKKTEKPPAPVPAPQSWWKRAEQWYRKAG
jgi:MFS family permease